ncbi:MAG: prepilin peptidase [Syntrophomonadaceae bacterium]|nr:prepilin peptidase [Syntrophomonadaceae bacterium]MDD3023810.1 prepilin peptidase [Syntrophomonadaceae bacterium]
MINYFMAAVFSIPIGSFLNVLIFRLPRKESIIWPRSCCPECGQVLKIQDLIPLINYIRLKGKCRYCRKSINLQYPLVEILTVILFVLVFHKWGLSAQLMEGCIFTAILLVASFTDINAGIIPDNLTYPGILTGLVLACVSLNLGNALWGAGIFGGVFFIIASLTNGGMGGGDIKLAVLIGTYTGIQGAVIVFILSSILAGIWVLILFCQGKANRKTKIKFGPFLAISAWLGWMYKPEIITAYWQLLK